MANEDLLAAVKARVAEDKAKHFSVSGWPTPKCAFCYAGEDAIATAAPVSWPCDAARYLGFAEKRLEWIEGALEPNPPREYKWQSEYDNCRMEDAESELASLAKLLGVQE